MLPNIVEVSQYNTNTVKYRHNTANKAEYESKAVNKIFSTVLMQCSSGVHIMCFRKPVDRERPDGQNML